MRKGTVILVPFPFTDLSGNKVRPCVVLFEQKNGEDCMVIFISSVVPIKKKTFDVTIKATDGNGLKKDSVIKVDKIATLQKKIVLGELGRIEGDVLKKVDEKLKTLLAL